MADSRSDFSPATGPGPAPISEGAWADPVSGSVLLSVVAAAHNEAENLPGLVSEVHAALKDLPSMYAGDFELIVVDDGSTDRTPVVMADLMATRPWLRCIRMQDTPAGRGHGQSSAFFAGIRAARGRLIATIDADLQNVPADLPAMLGLMRQQNADLVQGDRSRSRQDSMIRRLSSWVGRLFRRLLLGDRVRDTGCSLRVMRREVALRLPLEFRGMHRFIPALAGRMGYRVVEVPVSHRPRTAGVSKYGLGILQRAIPGLIDCFAVRWMGSRRRPTRAVELHPHTPGRTDGPGSVTVPARRPSEVTA
jgi:dolichol-phosphate mannosyltransferase